MGYGNSQGHAPELNLLNEIKGNEKVMKVNYFLGTGVMMVFSHPLFLP